MLIMEFSSDIVLLFSKITTSSITMIIQVINLFPRCFYGIRALFILLYFDSKKSAFQQLQLNMDSLQQLNHKFSFEEQNLTRKMTKLPWLSKILSLATTAVHVTFVMVDWQSMLVSSSTRSAEYCHFENACVSSLSALVLWSVTLDLSFILSQQVILCAVILTVVSTDMLSVLVNDIQRVIDNYQFKSKPSKKQVTALRRKILRWSVAYIAIEKFTDEINLVFGPILLATIGFDILSAVAYGSNSLRLNGPLFTADGVVYVTTCAMFTSYATLFLPPFVRMNEKVSTVKPPIRV